MSYADAPGRNRVVTVATVGLVHAGLAYALLSGLAVKVVSVLPRPPLTVIKTDPLPPPDPAPPPPAPAARSVTTPETVVAPRPLFPTDPGPMLVTSIPLSPASDAVTPITAPPMPAATPTPSLARGVAPRGNQGDWFPQDSYPAEARRAGAQGRVSVTVGVGADGRVTDCQVALSSGDESLDRATCRLAARNGRFQPALDEAGRPVASRFTVRGVRWELRD